jgi:acyl-coenzyme A thioesterase PaaI-like protein
LILRKLQPNSRHCFVCGLDNPFGLHLRFYETAPGEVTINCEIPEQYQGYPGVVHGGIVASIVDEALGRAHMGLADDEPRFMYTARLTIHYRKPVPVGKPLRIVGQAEKSKKRSGTSTASVFGPDGDLLVDAEALLVDIPPEMYQSEDLESLGWKVYPIEDE